MVEFTFFVVIIIAALAAFLCLLVFGITAIVKKSQKKPLGKTAKRLKSTAVAIAALVVIGSGIALFSQFFAKTPPILDQNGSVVEGSISELTKLEFNGRKQWISIRGHSADNPVLLFLAGGPGGSQLAAVRHELSELEKHFIVVGWDQPGSAKSYNSLNISKIDPNSYVEDGLALTNYLRERFGKEKIYLVGESWGSALGIFMAQRAPELFHAFVGTGQMVDFAETERIDYHKALELAQAANDQKTVDKLLKNGEPPYYGANVALRSAVYLNYLSAHMQSDPNITNPGYNTLRDVFSSEYGVIDKINYFLGIINTFGHVYQQLYGINLAVDCKKIDIPVYFFEGRYDINAPVSLVEDYFAVLEAPHKELIWFEHSGHSPWINERQKFVDELLKLL
jgi:pimeloyl-ACP methyl ester carboxylesterase